MHPAGLWGCEEGKLYASALGDKETSLSAAVGGAGKSKYYISSKVEDLDTTGEDHIADEVRYMCMANPMKPERTRGETKLSIYDPLSDDKPIGRYEYFLK